MEFPSPKSYPVVGHLPYIAGKSMGAVTSQLLMGDYGYNCVALNIGSMSLVAHANPEMVQQLVEETDNFGKEVHEFTRSAPATCHLPHSLGHAIGGRVL
mmetsp:Transcript_6835/g.19291  ORF Transcript_6835/g.19291 Transcript_6835/m.19291 type:complete len:99 (+) Transcript_6835:268-564(+)